MPLAVDCYCSFAHAGPCDPSRKNPDQLSEINSARSLMKAHRDSACKINLPDKERLEFAKWAESFAEKLATLEAEPRCIQLVGDEREFWKQVYVAVISLHDATDLTAKTCGDDAVRELRLRTPPGWVPESARQTVEVPWRFTGGSQK